MAKKPAAKPTKPSPSHSILRGMLTLACALALLFSLFSFPYNTTSQNWIGWLGSSIGGLFHGILGVGCYFVCFFLMWIGWRKLFCKPINHLVIKSLYIFLFVASLCVFLSMVEDQFPIIGKGLGYLFYPQHWQRKLHYHIGGALFYYLYKDLPNINLLHIFNVGGVALLSLSTFTASILFLTKTPPTHILKAIVWVWQSIRKPKETEEDEQPENEEEGLSRYVALKIPNSPQQDPNQPKESASSQEMLEIQPDANPTVRPSLSHKEKSDRKRTADLKIPEIAISTNKEESKEAPPSKKLKERSAGKGTGNFIQYALPSITLISTAKKVDQSSLKQDLRRQAEVLEETLCSFGIEAKVGQINCGPTITSFEVHPSIGVKVQKIKALENDIALNMEAKSIRIIAPIPGKAAVGIEVPNPQPQEVGFKEMLSAYQQGSRKFHVPILLGKAVNGEYVMSDLAKMPHCIIAGATGSGKSVCINTIVMSIVMNAKPDEIKLLMVDPKKVELTPYTRLPHMLAPVITEPQGACAALNWLVKEMESRYEILKQLGVRNIESFNNRTINKELEESLDREIPHRLPYIVLIIDELADLMMVSSNDIETPIARIAQMARAVGIHMILATQRPSREVITGLIKANFPTRISFKVASRVNSQIILDEIGAETLLGNGDMLFLPPGTSTLVRAQGAFIRDEDILAVINHISKQAGPNYAIASFDDLGKELQDDSDANQTSNNDSLYEQAVKIVLSTGNASTTFLQRKLKIGYARAASLIDEMEEQQVIGSSEGSKPRKILASRLSEKEANAVVNALEEIEEVSHE